MLYDIQKSSFFQNFERDRIFTNVRLNIFIPNINCCYLAFIAFITWRGRLELLDMLFENSEGLFLLWF